MTALHVIPACPRTCHVFFSWPPQHCHPPSCVNLPAASLSVAKGVNDISCQQGQPSPYVWHVQLLFVSCYKDVVAKFYNPFLLMWKIKGEGEWNFSRLVACWCLFQKQVLDATSKVVMVWGAVQGHGFSLTALPPFLRWGISYIFQWTSTTLTGFISQAFFNKNTWTAPAMYFSSSFDCFLENHSVLLWHLLLPHGRGDEVTSVSFSCEHRWNLWLLELYL